MMTVLLEYIAKFSSEDIFTCLKKWGALSPGPPGECAYACVVKMLVSRRI